MVAVGRHRFRDRAVQVDVDRMLRCCHLKTAGYFGDQVGQIDLAVMEVELAGFNPGDVQQLVDQSAQPGGLRVQELEPVQMPVYLCEPLLLARLSSFEATLHASQQDLREA